MTCPFALDDAAYVLGALEPAERQRYEEHLSDCRYCRPAVSDLAGLPGLLSRLPVEEVADLGKPTPPRPEVPPSLLPSLRRKAHRQRRFAQWRTGIITGAIAACLAAIISIVAVQLVDDHHDSQPVAAGQTVQLEPVNGFAMTASVTLTEESWGTSIRMDCQYIRPELPTYINGDFYHGELRAIDRDGNAIPVANWIVSTTDDMTINGSTTLSRDDIAALEIRNSPDTLLMQAQV